MPTFARFLLRLVVVAMLATGPLGMALAREAVTTEQGTDQQQQQQFAEEENEHKHVSLDEAWGATERPHEYPDGDHAVSAVTLGGCPTPPPEA